jgi:hypothetical protein
MGRFMQAAARSESHQAVPMIDWREAARKTRTEEDFRSQIARYRK